MLDRNFIFMLEQYSVPQYNYFVCVKMRNKSDVIIIKEFAKCKLFFYSE